MAGEEHLYAINLASIQEAAKRILGWVHRTPVFTCQTIERMVTKGERDVKVFFKVPRCLNMCVE